MQKVQMEKGEVVLLSPDDLIEGTNHVTAGLHSVRGNMNEVSRAGVVILTDGYMVKVIKARGPIFRENV